MFSNFIFQSLSLFLPDQLSFTQSTIICCCSMEFLYRSGGSDGPLVAFGGSDGVIRVLSMITWKVFFWTTTLFCSMFIILWSRILRLHVMLLFLAACAKIHWRSQRINLLFDVLHGCFWWGKFCLSWVAQAVLGLRWGEWALVSWMLELCGYVVLWFCILLMFFLLCMYLGI